MKKRGFFGNAFESASQWVSGSNKTKEAGEKTQNNVWNYIEKWMADIEVAHDKDELRNYCKDQLASLRNSIMYNFDLFIEHEPTLLYQLEYFKTNLPDGVSLADLSSQYDFMPYYRNHANSDVVGCLQLFDTIATYARVSLARSNPKIPPTTMPFNVEGLKYFYRSLQDINDEVFFSAIANTKLWYLYDLPKLLTVVTNILYYYNDVSFITLLCTAEGFLDLWSLLKLTPYFKEKLAKKGLAPEWVQAFQSFCIFQRLMRSYPGSTLASFKFAFDLTLERMEFLQADPNDFEMLEVIGAGSMGVVRKMRYKGKMYAIKSIHPYFNREEAGRGRKRTGSFGSLFRAVEVEKEQKSGEDSKSREGKGKEKETQGSPSKETVQKGDEKTSFVNGLEYMKKIEQLGTESSEAKKDDFWKWLYSQLGEYISMLVLPREGFVKLYYCYVGKRPSPPRYYCPNCFQNKYETELVFEDVIDEEAKDEPPKRKVKCNYCSTTLTETFYGEDSLHLVLEYCAEGSLEQYLEKKLIPTENKQSTAMPKMEYDPDCAHLGVSLPEDKILSFLCQILSALAYHHARGVVHEDLKPANIMMRDDNTLCLGDFGLSSFTKKGSESHGSPDYNPPEINSRGALSQNYDSAKADIWGVGCIALEMFGFKIPCKNIPKALQYLSDNCSPILAKAIGMMLEVDYTKRKSALFCLIHIENFKKGLEKDIGHSASDISYAIEHMDEEALGNMAEVMEHYQLLDDVDQTIPLITKKTHCVFKDYTQGAVVCCKFYLTLLESQSPKIMNMCCTHLARLVSNERLRPLILELDLIKRLSTLLFQMGINERLQLLIVDTFCVLTEITSMGGSTTALMQILSLNVLPSLLDLLPHSKSPLIRTAIQVVFENCFHMGIPLEYYNTELDTKLWRLVLYSNSLEDRALALRIIKSAILAFPALEYEDRMLTIFDLSNSANEGLQRMKDFAKLRKRGFNATPVYLYLMMVTQFAKRKKKAAQNYHNQSIAEKENQQQDKGKEKEKENEKENANDKQIDTEDQEKEKEVGQPGEGNKEVVTSEKEKTEVNKKEEETTERRETYEEMEERQIQLFVRSDRVKRVMSDVFVDLLARSRKFRELKGLFKDIMCSCQAIEKFYTQAEFPIKCSGCGGAIVGTLYHCMACAIVYFCADCFNRGSDLPKQYYFKHSAREHARQVVVYKRSPNPSLVRKLKHTPIVVAIREDFMNMAKFIKACYCPLCGNMRAYRMDACNRLLCTKCGFIFCLHCHLPYGEWDKEKEGTPLHALQYFIAHDEKIGFDNFLSQEHYEMMMDLLFRHAKTVHNSSLYPLIGGISGQRDLPPVLDPDNLCKHPTFQSNQIFLLPIRCSVCREKLDPTAEGTIEGECGHKICLTCITKATLKSISIGALHSFPDSFYGIKCPVTGCTCGLLSDPHRIKTLVNQDFYDLYIYVACLLSAGTPISTAWFKCTTCGRKIVVDSKSKPLCYKCFFHKESLPPRLQKQGWLTKKSSGVIAVWQRRYFSIDATGMLSYTEQPVPSNQTKGKKKVLNLERDLKRVSDDANEEKKFRFSIVTNRYDEAYEVYADTLEEKKEWMEAIASWIKKMK